MAQGRPYQAYQNTSIQTASQKQLILMLYDGMSRFLSKAVMKIEENDVQSAHNLLNRVEMILAELLSTLREDRGGEIAQNLKTLYVYCYEKIVQANLYKDENAMGNIIEVQKIMNNLREGWVSTEKTHAKMDMQSATPRKISVIG